MHRDLKNQTHPVILPHCTQSKDLILLIFIALTQGFLFCSFSYLCFTVV